MKIIVTSCRYSPASHNWCREKFVDEIQQQIKENRKERVVLYKNPLTKIEKISKVMIIDDYNDTNKHINYSYRTNDERAMKYAMNNNTNQKQELDQKVDRMTDQIKVIRDFIFLLQNID